MFSAGVAKLILETQTCWLSVKEVWPFGWSPLVPRTGTADVRRRDRDGPGEHPEGLGADEGAPWDSKDFGIFLVFYRRATVLLKMFDYKTRPTILFMVLDETKWGVPSTNGPIKRITAMTCPADQQVSWNNLVLEKCHAVNGVERKWLQ